MAFPVIESSNTTADTSSTSVTVNMPSGIVAGNLLIVFCAQDAVGTITQSGGSDWTKVEQNVNGTECSQAIFAKIAAGSDTLTLTSTDSQDFSCVSVRISGHGITAIADIVKGTAATGSDAAPNPPNCAPSGSAKDYLWIEMFAADDDDDTGTYESANYTQVAQIQSANSASSCLCAVASRNLNATSENPGVMAMAAIEGWVAQTIAIRPYTSKTLTIDTILKKLSLTKTLTIDTVLKKVSIPKTLTIDAVLKAVVPKTLTIDTVLKKLSIPKTLTIDTVLSAPPSFPTNSSIIKLDWTWRGQPFTKIQAKSTIDTRKLDWVWRGKPFTPNPFDSGAAPVTKTLTIDTVLKKLSILKTLTIDTVLKKLDITKTLTIDVVLKKVFTKTLTLDTILKKLNVQKTLTIDTILKKLSIPKTLTIDVVLLKQFTKTLTLDTILKKLTILKTFTIDTTLLKVFTKTLTIDTVLKKLAVPKTFTLDTILKKLNVLKTLTIDAVLTAGAATKTFTIDTILKKLAILKTFTIDTVLLKQFTNTLTIDVVLKKVFTKTLTLDTVLKKVNILKTLTVDAVLKKLDVPRTLTFDTILKKLAVLKTFTIDAVLSSISTHTKTFTIDLVLKKLDVLTTFSIDVVLAGIEAEIVYTTGGPSKTLNIIKVTRSLMFKAKLIAPQQLPISIQIPIKQKIMLKIDTLVNLTKKNMKTLRIESNLVKKATAFFTVDVKLNANMQKVLERKDKLSFNRIKKLLLLGFLDND